MTSPRHPKTRKTASALIFLLLAYGTVYAAPVRLRCEYMDNPLGIDAPFPHLSWQSDSAERNWKQAAYQVLVATTADKLRTGKPDVWDSGRRDSSASVDIEYAGPALQSGQRYYWTVRVWDQRGTASVAALAWWEMGLLSKSDWTARWIARRDDESEDRKGIRLIGVADAPPPPPPPVPASPPAAGQAPSPPAAPPMQLATASYRLDVEIKKRPVTATMFISAGSGYKVVLNGRPLYSKRSWPCFDRQDIVDRVAVGQNVFEVTLTPARVRGGGLTAVTGGFTALLKVTYANGAVERFPSNDAWQGKMTSDTEWKAVVVGDPLGELKKGRQGNLPQSAALLRKEFDVAKRVKSARFYVTALGSYRLFLNSQRVGNDVMTPEFTNYVKRVIYQTYDVTSLLVSGRNAIGAMLGDGWFLSGLVESGDRLKYLPAPTRLLAQLRIDYADGSSSVVGTDETWRTAAAPILHSEIYDGETYDARLEQPGWNKAGFDQSAWAPVLLPEAPAAILAAQMTTPARVLHTLKPESVKALPGGAYVFDMGQNMVGWAVLKAQGAAGTVIRLRHAEVLNPDGTIYTENLRNADATDMYILRGGGEETFRPYFTFHGFRYVEVTGYPGTPTVDSLLGEVVTSVGPEPAATLQTSSDLVNRFWEVGIWGQRGNFLSIPTDCPQRDERLGWTGDAQAFWRTGSYNFDIASFGRQWMRSVVDEQSEAGAFTPTVPAAIGGVGAPGWGDAGVIVPWTAWMHYGDTSIVREHWAAMERWMAFIETTNPDYLRRKSLGGNYGDHLAVVPQTPRDLIGTAYWVLVADQMSEMARAIGREADAQRYAATAEKVRAAFRREFIRDDGTVTSGTQTSYLVALNMKIAPAALVPKLVENLVKDIEARDWHLTTGFLGTPFLLFTLSDNGRTDVAYRLLLNETYPSWGYMLSKGATTWWERWNSDAGDPTMNSYNHYAFGSVVAWVYRYVVGIDTSGSGPGFKEIVVRPRPDARITRARGEYESVRGKITVAWSRPSADVFALQVTIPANTTAKVYLPVVGGGRVTEGGKAIQPRREGEEWMVPVGSGTYALEVR